MANQRVKLEGPTQQANAELPLVNPPDIEDDIRPIRGKEVAGEIIIPSLPWWLMLLLVIVPSISWGYAAIKNRPNLLRPFRSRLRKKNAFVVARKEIKNIFEQKTIFSLSTVFVQLFAARCSVDESAINQEFILHSLRKAGIQEDELEQWNQFYNQLNELKFFNKPTKPNEALVLQHYATHWINRLEEVL
jgi:hypothetical protein